MQLYQLSKIAFQKTKRRVGRGGKRGTYSGRGVKGQKARAGRKLRPAWRDTLKRIPKKRGYRFNTINAKPVVLNLAILDKAFKEGALINPASLFKQGLIKKPQGRWPAVKILGGGSLSKKFDFAGLEISAKAQELITKAGGTITLK